MGTPCWIYQHLYFNDTITVNLGDQQNFKMVHYGHPLENELFWKGLYNGWEKYSMRVWAGLSVKAIFNADCLSCHSARDSRGNYSVSTYADVMQRQHPGDARGSLVVDCSPGGSMYPYFSGDGVTKATEVFRWMVVYNAAQTR